MPFLHALSLKHCIALDEEGVNSIVAETLSLLGRRNTSSAARPATSPVVRLDDHMMMIDR